MNFSQFAGFYKESLIQMIYENCQQKNQLSIYDCESDKLESFKKMQKIFDTVETQNGLNIPQHFRDKLFYLQYQTKGVSFCKMLNKEDIKFIYDLVQIYEMQKKVSLIFGVDNRLISKIILQYKRESGIEIKQIQRNYQANKQKKSKTTSANQHFSINNNDEGLGDDSSVSQEQVNKEKVFNPFDKDTSKENTVIRKVRFQDLAQPKQEISSKPVNKLAKPEQDKEKLKPSKNQQTDNNQNEVTQKPSKLITVKLEDSHNENNLSQEQENQAKREKESQQAAKPRLAHKGVKEGDKHF
ncbi:hypothetical protein ABPG72_021634 [Tetrahymena utriculariae]